MMMSPMLIAGYAVAYGVAYEDYDKVVGVGDVVGQGAFAALLAKGDFRPQMLLSHEGEPIGQWLDFQEDDIGLLAIGSIDRTSPRGLLASQMVESGEIKGLSTNMCGLARPIAGTKSRVCVQVFKSREISLATNPSNPMARLLSFTAGTA
ncbi:HK97 family phage prohead protease [Mesorhizobium sp. B2-3-3]|nr:HK97 family phage prohead protease [Mesorhizobium sp. B2-3-3]